ncbi:MAG: DUF4349 domain-containing protein [Anaerolineae bacterium]|nr:DUF4349 domain-containing protein [Anaerolineae bacterium]
MWKKIGFAVLTICCLLAILAACGGTPEPSLLSGETVVEQVMVERAVVEATRALAATQAPAAEVASAAGSPGLAAPTIPRVERMIIKDAEIDLIVTDSDTAIDSVTLIAADYGGYIISSHTWFEAEYKYATIRLGVPAEEFENVLRRLRGLAVKVANEVATGEDVTDQFVDLQSRLTNLEATRDRIREFLDKAETVEEALKVNEQLSQVEAQIEEIQGRMNYLSDRAAYSTITVHIIPDKPTPTPSPTPTPTPVPAWNPGETLTSATGALTTILKALVEIGIWVLVVLVPLILPVALVVWLVLRRRRPAAAHPTAGDTAT